jgi:hypothetical protein
MKFIQGSIMMTGGKGFVAGCQFLKRDIQEISGDLCRKSDSAWELPIF